LVSGSAFPHKPKIPDEIMGVGAVKRFGGVKWTAAERNVWAWLLILPATGLIGYLLARLAHHWS
jgi:PiT family inorganic phosphate transporter